jgi:hypothetical protein
MRALVLAALVLLLTAVPASAAPELASLGSFTEPVHVASPPGDSRVFVVEQAGVIKIAGGGTFLDLTGPVLAGGERGLLSMAFAPDYASSGLFYVFMTTDPAGDVEVHEYRASASAPPVFVRPLLDVAHSATNHNGGQLQFGPDGALYASIGDNAHAPNARDPASPFGKIHRIDTATGATSIWSSGLRNPWRFSFDPPTGDLLIGDVGGSYEEVNWARGPNAGQGVDWGWNCNDGPNGSCGTRAAFWQPNGPFCAIIGGLVVRDPGLPTLNGRYLYGDNCNQSVWSTVLGSGGPGEPTGLTVANLSSFGTNTCGHVFVASRGSDAVYRILDGQPGSCVPTAPVPTPAPDTAAPRLTVGKLRAALNRRRLRVAVSCDEACRVRVGGRFRGVRKLSVRRRSLPAASRRTVTFKLSRKTARAARRAVRRRGHVRLLVTVRASDATGNESAVVRRGRVNRR